MNASAAPPVQAPTPPPAAVNPGVSGIDAVWRTINGMFDAFMAMLPLLAAGIIVFLLLMVLAGLVRRLAERGLARTAEPNAVAAIGRIAYVAMAGLAALVA